MEKAASAAAYPRGYTPYLPVGVLEARTTTPFRKRTYFGKRSHA